MKNIVLWIACAFFSAMAIVNILYGDLGAVFFIVFALISLPHPKYKAFLKRNIPSPDIRLIVGIAAILISVLILPDVLDAVTKIQLDPSASTASNIGRTVGYVIGTIFGNLVLLG